MYKWHHGNNCGRTFRVCQTQHFGLRVAGGWGEGGWSGGEKGGRMDPLSSEFKHSELFFSFFILHITVMLHDTSACRNRIMCYIKAHATRQKKLSTKASHPVWTGFDGGGGGGRAKTQLPQLLRLMPPPSPPPPFRLPKQQIMPCTCSSKIKIHPQQRLSSHTITHNQFILIKVFPNIAKAFNHQWKLANNKMLFIPAEGLCAANESRWGRARGGGA